MHGDGGAQVLAVASPMRGWVWPLPESGDPAFASGALGPGLAVDPLDPLVTAPIGGEVVSLNASNHAVVIRAECGAEVLVHVGIDTVELDGNGFTAKVALGDRVVPGQPLLEVDLARVAQAGKNLVSPVVVITPESVTLSQVAHEGPVERGDLLFVATLADTATATMREGGEQTRRITVGLAHGLHARPAAALAQIMRETSSQGVLVSADGEADLRSVVALMRAGIGSNDRVELRVTGQHCESALDRIEAILSGEFTEAEAHEAAPPALIAEGRISGLTGSPGVAVGPAFAHAARRFELRETGESAEHELELLASALARAASGLSGNGAQGALGQVVAAHRELLDDPELRLLAEAGITSGRSAAWSWNSAVEQVCALLSQGDVRLAQRQADVRDIGLLVLEHMGIAASALATPPAGAIVLADDLLPSDLAHYSGHGVAGVALAGSGPTAHVAIIAAGLELPLLAGCGVELQAIAAGQEIVLDATGGLLDPEPDEAALDEARRHVEALASERAADRAASLSPAITADGARIAVHANLGGVDDAGIAVGLGAEGCGLLRTEFLFLDRDAPPDEEEQLAAYRSVLTSLEGRPLTLRTLDVGGDKPARFLPIAAEENPALGLRGIRVGLAHPDVFEVQLRAALRAAAEGPLELMVPMISGLAEWRAVRELVERLQAGLDRPIGLRLGMMIETPAAVLLADRLSAEADFLSIGTNDLTQYVLAMDRTNPAVAKAADPLHPAVLRAIAGVVQGAQPRGCPVSVCGGMAADPLAIPLLVGLGITKLSVVPAAVAATKRIVRGLDSAAWKDFASAALELDSAEAVRAFVKQQSTSEGESR